MQKIRFLRLCGLGLLMCVSCLAQEVKTRSAPIQTAVMEALLQSRSQGGIEVNRGCSDLPQVKYQIAFRDPEASLQSIQNADKMTVSVSKRKSAYRVVIAEKHFRAHIASVTIPKKVIEAASLSYAVDVLLQDPLIRRQIAKLHFEELPVQLGFTSILEGKNRSITIPAGRLDDALDAIARSFGPAVWQITERTCGRKKAFGVGWVIR